jgi:hypothetical protein
VTAVRIIHNLLCENREVVAGAPKKHAFLPPLPENGCGFVVAIGRTLAKACFVVVTLEGV